MSVVFNGFFDNFPTIDMRLIHISQLQKKSPNTYQDPRMDGKLTTRATVSEAAKNTRNDASGLGISYQMWFRYIKQLMIQLLMIGGSSQGTMNSLSKYASIHIVSL